MQVSVSVDREIPYGYAGNLSLPRAWRDGSRAFVTDFEGNEYASDQEQADGVLTAHALAADISFGDYLKLYLREGENLITVTIKEGSLVLEGMTFGCRAPPPAYEDYILSHNDAPVHSGAPVRIEAEHASLKSDRFLPSSERSDPKTSPIASDRTLLNVIGDNWSENGEWIEWVVEAPEDGLYALFFRYMQYALKGFMSNRRLYVNGEVPFDAADCVEFPFNTDWDGMWLAAPDGGDALIYLRKGENTLRLEVVNGKLNQVMHALSVKLVELQGIYRSIIMVTGVNTDKYRDYNLFTAIPDLRERLEGLSAFLKDAYIEIQRINDNPSKEAEILNVLAFQIDGMVKDPRSIANRLVEFSANIISYAAMVNYARTQPLMLDYMELRDPDGDYHSVRSNFAQTIWLELRKFFWSFFRDYTTVNKVDDERSITMWIGGGRDEAEMLSRIIRERFTSSTGIHVNIKLINARISMVEAFLSNQVPDVSVALGQSMPVDLAARGALLDLSRMDGFDEVMSHFAADAAVPFTYRGGVYGIPDGCNFFAMFYRKDIFDELGLAPPATWDEYLYAVSVIQRHKMEVTLPPIVQQNTLKNNGTLGSANILIMLSLAMQMGGRFYSDDLSRALLDSPEVRSAFIKWTDFYDKYGFQQTYDFYNRFRTGEMPLGIYYYPMSLQLHEAAPEIEGLWEMAPLPGTITDGELNNVQASSYTAAVVLSKTEKADYAWEFIKWWASPETMAIYSDYIEANVGPLGRATTANIDTVDLMRWTASEAEFIKEQLSLKIKTLPEIPGSYYLTRSIENAFGNVVNQARNPVEALNYWNGQVNGELARKRREFGGG